MSFTDSDVTNFEPDTADVVDVVSTENDAPTDGGQGEETVTPEPTYFDVDSYADHLVKVKVDGEELEVPLREVTSGYMRQADYTRKTQTAAQQRQEAEYALAVLEGLRQDPETTIEILRRQQIIQDQQAAQQGGVVDDFEWPEDPVQRALMEQRMQYEQEIAPVRQFMAKQMLQEQVGALKSTFGIDDAEVKAVVAEAVRRGHRDGSQLASVYKEMAFDRMRAQQLAQGDLAQRTAAETAQRQAAASQITSHSQSRNVAPAPPPTSVNSIADAWAAAKAELGITGDVFS